MFEYIKRVSVAISFIAQKVSDNDVKLKNVLEEVSFDLLLIAQKFKSVDYKVNDLKKLEEKISYLIDVVEFGKINTSITAMNADVFINSQVNFLKHIVNLIDQKNSLTLPAYNLKNLEEILARKQAKGNLQNSYSSANNITTFDFSETPSSENLETKNLENISHQNSEKNSPVNSIEVAKVQPKNIQESNQPETEEESEGYKPEDKSEDKIEPPKKILEESIITPVNHFTSPQSIEKEIEERRNKILKCLVNGGGSIRDIAIKLPDLNEKTIQRDLLGLMREKKVIMLGKKRWAKYYLK
jgi:hypothetical protein